VEELIVHLDAPLPESLAVGAGTAVFVSGTCFCPSERVRSLHLVVDGEVQSLMAHGMPRLDLFRAQHPDLDPFETGGIERDPGSPDDPGLHSYSSGFWGMARIFGDEATRECELLLRARLEGGATIETELARIPIEDVGAPAAIDPPEPSAGPLVAICMATYDPAPEMFLRQLNSIRAQTHRNWVCVISDDCSRPERFAAIEEAVAGDPRVVISRSPRRLGFYRNFERALGMAPAGARYVAMADQDDSWHADKLETLIGVLGDAQLVYSDARIVDLDGDVVSDTYWTHRHNNHRDMASLLMANCVTGAASLFRRGLLDDALPFPPAQFSHFHDHWVALTALALGDIAFVERPLYDYIQHGDAVIGHAAANGLLSVNPRLGRLQRLRENPRERVVRWRMTFFVANCRLTQYATVLRMRCRPRMARGKRRAIERYLGADRAVSGLAWLWFRARREFAGRPETLGAELGLLVGFLWRRALTITARDRPTRRLRMDALPPPNLVPGPRARQPTGSRTRGMAGRISPLGFAAGDEVPARVNVLLPSVDVQHSDHDRIAALNLALRLSRHGLRARIVTTDTAGPLPRAWQRQIESQAGLDGFFASVEVVFGREAHGIEVSRSDGFVATTWRTAHVAQHAMRAVGGERFLYLIQDHEPSTFAPGSHAALANQTYSFPHQALFSSELLRDYFRRNGIGVYAAGREAGARASACFQYAVSPVARQSAQDVTDSRAPSLLFYARPEADAARNLFELGVLGLDRALADGAFEGWNLCGFGADASESHIDVGGGALLKMLPLPAPGAYPEMLHRHDVGLALMYAPHPGRIPLEMAAAGMLTVTNSFENKTREAMAEISSNLITGEPTVGGIAAGLREAAAGVTDRDRRERGAQLRWSRSWDRSFDGELLDRVAAFLAP